MVTEEVRADPQAPSPRIRAEQSGQALLTPFVRGIRGRSALCAGEHLSHGRLKFFGCIVTQAKPELRQRPRVERVPQWQRQHLGKGEVPSLAFVPVEFGEEKIIRIKRAEAEGKPVRV